MEHHERELLVARIVSGSIRVRLWEDGRERLCLLKTPTRQARYEAEEVYREVLEESGWEGLWSEPELLGYLVAQGLWDDERQALLTAIEKDIEELKVKLCEYVFRREERKAGKKALAVAKTKQTELLAQRHLLDHLTAAGTAAMAKVRFLVGTGLCLPTGEPVLPLETFWDDSSPLLDKAVEAYYASRLDEVTFRELARTEPWRALWAGRSAAGSVFGLPAADLTDEQRTLQVWSQMYDSIAEHPEGPSQDVIDDDDLLDGWLILQRRKRDKAQTEKKVDGLLTNDKIKNAQEVFVPVGGMEEAREIESMNDLGAKMTKAQRIAYLRKKGVRVPEAELPDVRMSVQMAQNQGK